MKTTLVTNRIQWVDLVKFFCIIFVMMSHLESNTSVAMAFYHPFYLSGFFFASGYVYRHKSNFKSFFVRKVKGLFVPWLVFSLFNIALSQLLSFNEHAGILEELKWNFLQIRGIGDGVWFVAALFIAFIPFYFVVERYEKFGKKARGILLLVLLLFYGCSVVYTKYMNPTLLPWNSVALPWHVEYIPQALFFMSVGYFFKGNVEKRLDKYNTWMAVVAVLFLYLCIVYIPFAFQWQGPVPVQLLYEHICKFIGTVLLVMVCKKLKTNRYFSFVGSNTLIYFALHGKVYSVIEMVLNKMATAIYTGILNNTICSTVFALLFTVAITLILIPAIWVISNWFPFVLGKKRQ